MSQSPAVPPPPPWEVVGLVCQYMNPETLALCSCVCKLWYDTMSSDQIWKPICFTHYPPLSFLFQQQHHHNSHPTTIPFRRLYALGYVSSKIRGLRNPSKPRISMEDLIFAVDVFKGNSHVLNIARQGEDLVYKDGVFRFDSDVNFELKDDMCGDTMRVTWSIVMKGWTGVFLAMDCEGKGMSIGYGGGGERWFSQALPASPGCCWCSFPSSVISSNCNNKNGLLAELGLCFSSVTSRRKKMDKVKMGFLSVGSWRYTNMDDALLYLQHFLLHFP
ncbi:probable F-box protein At5g04010 [Papaver somniferum]|uniref:probable F-box protein At5g04010 n=1 Tax=Papaver somniferum TaxID=3469 RepID=UPI000E6F74A3|nr:probable F-box protein At5g04010 [Papaver somniferum]